MLSMMGLTAGRMFGIGGTSPWRDVGELFLLGCGNVQVCTATLHYGYRSVEDMANDLLNWMSEKGFRKRHRLQPIQGLADLRQRT